MSCNIHALNIGRFVLCETGPEHQRRSIVQPRVVPAGRDYPGSDAPVSSTLKGLYLPCPSAQAHPRKTNRHGLRREARKLSGRDAFARTKVIHHSKTPRPPESGAKATALQTLTRLPSVSHVAKRLECGVFTAALARTKAAVNSTNPRPLKSGVTAALCHRIPRRLRDCPQPPCARSVLECGGPPPLSNGSQYAISVAIPCVAGLKQA